MTSISQALTALRDHLRDTRFPLELGHAADSRTTRDELVDQIDDYALPRLAQIDAPLLAVIGGSTGAGKSTITNSLIGTEVSAAGVLRPTTRTPVLVCNPADQAWFMSGGVLPDLPRSTGERPTGAGVHIVTTEAVPAGLGVLDSPDIDSIETANHQLAAQLLGAADLWLFVTTAARYADAVPWEYLSRAQERATALAMVVNRIPPGAEQEVAGHLQSMLDERNLATTRLFLIAEAELDAGRIAEGIAPVRDWLTDLVSDAESRAALVRQTLDGVLDSVPARIDRLAIGLADQASGADALRTQALARYQTALQQIEHEFDSGNLLQGEVLEAWREHVGTGEWMDRLQRGVGRLRNRIGALFTGRPQPEAQAQGQLESNLAVLVRSIADEAALDVTESWEALPGGRSVIDQAERGIDRSSPELPKRLATQTEEWQQGVLDLVTQEAGNKVALARTLSVGLNSVGVTLMMVVFSQTGGVTGGEAAIAGGTAAVSQAVLSAIFGEQAVRDLARTSRRNLIARLQVLLDLELARFDRLLSQVPDQNSAAELQDALALVEAARQ